MASKSTAKKTIATKAKKKVVKEVKKNKGLQALLVIFVLIIIVLIGVVGFLGKREMDKTKELIDEFEFDIPTYVSEDISLPNQINDEIKISWQSSNQKYLSTAGAVVRPGFEDSDTNVTLTATFSIEYQSIFASILNSVLKENDITKEFVITVLKEEADDEKIVSATIDKIYLPSSTFSSIALPKVGYYEGTTITWTSSNNGILDADGKVTTPGSSTVVTLTATVKCGDVTREKEFEVEVLNQDFEIVVADDNFDDQAETSRYNEIKSVNSITYTSSRIIMEEGYVDTGSDLTDVNKTTPNYIRMRSTADSDGKFYFSVSSPSFFSFDYKFDGTQKTEASNLLIQVQYTKDSKSEEWSEEVQVKHLDNYTTYTLDFSTIDGIDASDDVLVTVTHVNAWGSDTFLLIDNVKVTNHLTIEDIASWVEMNVASTLTSSILLPTTTKYGASLTWTTSDNSVISSVGFVTRSEENKTATLTCQISYLGKEKTITLEVVVRGTVVSTPLEIYFIDIGKYGAGDCGEVTYIKYGDMDIIVDAGDHFDATIKATTEAINQHLTDGVIEYIIATHPDGDHIGGMSALFETFEIENLIKFEGEYTTQKFNNLKLAYEAEGCNVYEIYSDIISPSKGENFIVISDEINIDFIDTTYYLADESNGKSIVFVLEAYGTRVLMTGDADNASGHTDLEEKYMQKVGDVDILKVVHHGTQNGTTSEFLNVVDPEVAIICNGNYLGNKHGHPTPKAISRLYQHDSSMKVYAICGGGTIDGTVTTSGTYKCSSEDRFNERNGTITILITNTGYTLSSEYYLENIKELNTTIYYKALESNSLL